MTTALVVLLVLFALALLVIIALAAQLNDSRTRARWLAMELKDAQETGASLRKRLAPFRGVSS